MPIQINPAHIQADLESIPFSAPLTAKPIVAPAVELPIAGPSPEPMDSPRETVRSAPTFAASQARKLRAWIGSFRGNPIFSALAGPGLSAQAAQPALRRLFDGDARRLAAPLVLAVALGHPSAASNANAADSAARVAPAHVYAAARDATPSRRFARLADDYWDSMMRWSPLDATLSHYPRYHDRLEDNSARGRARQAGEARALLARLINIDRSRLLSQEKISWDVMKLQLELILERQRYLFWAWDIEHIDGPQSAIPSAIELSQPMETEQDARALLARMRAFPAFFQNHIANLKQGLAEGRAAPHTQVSRTIEQLEGILKAAPEDSPYATAGKRLPSALQAKYLPLIMASVRKDVYPAYRAYLAFLKNRYLAKARSDGKPGLVSTPDGRRAYRYMIRYHTTLDKSPDELHRMGLDQLEDIHARMREIARRNGHTDDVAAFMEQVRRDPGNFFRTREEIVRAAQDMVARLESQLPRFFKTLPKTPLVVKPIEPYREKNDADAEYHPMPDDLSGPGIYYVNTYEPGTRPRFNLAANTLHEALPGHHLQIALAAENRALPTFRRQGDFFNAFVEGWAYYAEGLGVDMGAYPDDLSRLGMLSNEALRACRLVLDTGIHAKGWSRQQAIDFMRANTPLSEEEVEVEVDRYILWPGQALAYAVGKEAILDLRRELEAKLGPRFDIRVFHEAVLENGVLPLSLLRELVLEKILKGPKSP